MVLAGAGKAFCAGADLNWMKRMAGYGYEDNLEGRQRARDDAEDARPHVQADRRARARARLRRRRRPGAACDIAIGSQDAEFCLTEVKLGPVARHHQPLRGARDGRAAGAALFPHGRVIDAGEGLPLAAAVGCLPAEELDGAVNAILGHLVVGGKAAHAKIKDLVRTVAQGRPTTP
jgi:methylglutaconyl-CoA hydratase